MSGSVNVVHLVGHLGNDPTVRTSNNGKVVSMSLATSESWKDKNTGQKQERTEWHKITVFGKLADICAQYLHKGDLVYISGSLRTDKYTDKEGVEKYTTSIIARDMQMLGGKGQSESRPEPVKQAATASADFEEDISF